MRDPKIWGIKIASANPEPIVLMVEARMKKDHPVILVVARTNMVQGRTIKIARIIDVLLMATTVMKDGINSKDHIGLKIIIARAIMALIDPTVSIRTDIPAAKKVARVDIVKTSDPAVNMEIVRNMVAKVVGMTIVEAEAMTIVVAEAMTIAVAAAMTIVVPMNSVLIIDLVENMEIARNMVAKVVGMTIMSADLANSMIADMVNKERCVLAIMAMIAINKTIEVEAAGATSIAIQ
jgi:hypothetical protein